MPAGQPFTQLCFKLGGLQQRGRHRVDLHLHSTHSDGAYEPEEIVSIARRSGLAAIAITDHDTVSAVQPALDAAAGSDLEVIAGVEISCEHLQSELHLLALFVDVSSNTLLSTLQTIRRDRANRFLEMIDRLGKIGVDLQRYDVDGECQVCSPNGVVTRLRLNDDVSLSRGTLAELLVRHQQVATVREAFHRFLADGERADVPKKLISLSDAIRCAHGAGGVTSWAHPPQRAELAELRGMRELGLDAVEVTYPQIRPKRSRELRKWANQLELAVTGGSDCHGPGEARRAIGACGISVAELEELRARKPRRN